MTVEKLITARDVAERVGVRVATIYSWANTGALPAYRVGRLLRFHTSEVDAWLSRLRASGCREDRR